MSTTTHVWHTSSPIQVVKREDVETPLINQLNILQQQMVEQQFEIQTLQGYQQGMRMEVSENTDLIKQLDLENEKLKAILDYKREDLKVLRNQYFSFLDQAYEKTDLQLEYFKLKNRLQRTEKELSSEIEQLSQEIEYQKNFLENGIQVIIKDSSQSQINEAGQQIQEAQNRILLLTQEIGRLNQLLNQKQNEVNNLQKKLKQAEQDSLQNNQILISHKQYLERLQSIIDNKNEDITLKKQEQTLEGTLSYEQKLQSEVDQLNQLIRSKQEEVDNLKRHYSGQPYVSLDNKNISQILFDKHQLEQEINEKLNLLKQLFFNQKKNQRTKEDKIISLKQQLREQEIRTSQGSYLAINQSQQDEIQDLKKQYRDKHQYFF